MTDGQKKLADDMVNHFKNTNGLHLNARELANPLKATEKEIKYVASMLTGKGVFNKTEPMILSHLDVVPESYFLTDKGWTYNGYDKLLEEERKKELLLEQQTQSIIDTNISVQNTNASIKEVNASTKNLNEHILPDTFRTQRRQGERSIWIAVASLLFIGMTAYFQWQDQTANRIKELQEQIHESRQSLDSINNSFKGIKSAIEILANDTTK